MRVNLQTFSLADGKLVGKFSFFEFMHQANEYFGVDSKYTSIDPAGSSSAS